MPFNTVTDVLLSLTCTDVYHHVFPFMSVLKALPYFELGLYVQIVLEGTVHGFLYIY